MAQRIGRSTLSLMALVLVTLAPAAIAHPGHEHADDGRIPGQPDVQRHGTVEVRFHPKAKAYTYKRNANEPPMWFHAHDDAATRAGETALPTTEEPVLCTSTGHRIRVMYSSATIATPPSHNVEQIRDAVRRMGSKVLSESMRSSGNTRGLRLPVECDVNGEIRVFGFKSSNDADDLFEGADSFGHPGGANSVKNLVFYSGENPAGCCGGGIAQMHEDDVKSSSDAIVTGSNNNRILSSTGVVYTYAWDRDTTLHELFHTMGAVQDDSPYSSFGGHCIDGIDVMCYEDDGYLGSFYSEDRCPKEGDFDTSAGIPLDCAYDTYFDALEESGEYLASHWDVAGVENPFLVTAPAAAAPTIKAVPPSSVTKSSATLNATVTPNGLSTSYRFEYGLTTSYTSKVPVPDASLGSNLYNTQTVSQAIKGLQPATTYHYRVVAANDKGGAFSKDEEFTTPGWSIVSTPNATGAEHSYLNDISCEPASTSACTAVGKQTAAGGASSPYAQYWNGSSWANQSTASPAGSTAADLQANHCLSKTSCVAAGSYTAPSGTFSLIEAWNGTSWSIQSSPNPAGATETRLNGVSCKVITACVAVGYKGSGSSSQPVALGGNSGAWSLQSVPLPAGAVGAELTGAECLSATSCKAVGRYYPTSSSTTYWAMIASWNGTSWSSEAAPKPTGSPKRSTLLDISCAGSSSCTAVGGYMNSSGVQVSYVERWNGASWSWQASPNPAGSLNTPLQNVSCVENSPCVAVGDWLEEGVWFPLALYWNGSSWILDPVPAHGSQSFGMLGGVACRTTCLAVGWYTISGKDKTLGEIE